MTQGVSFDPTEDQRRTVRAMSGFGVPHNDIATLLDIDPKTLRKHFRNELDRGSIEATAKVGQSLFRMATEGNNVAAAIFWMKARAGWREKHEVQLSMPDSFTPLSDAELQRVIDSYGRRENFGEADAKTGETMLLEQEPMPKDK